MGMHSVFVIWPECSTYVVSISLFLCVCVCAFFLLLSVFLFHLFCVAFSLRSLSLVRAWALNTICKWKYASDYFLIRIFFQNICEPNFCSVDNFEYMFLFLLSFHQMSTSNAIKRQIVQRVKWELKLTKNDQTSSVLAQQKLTCFVIAEKWKETRRERKKKFNHRYRCVKVIHAHSVSIGNNATDESKRSEWNENTKQKQQQKRSNEKKTAEKMKENNSCKKVTRNNRNK